MQFPSRCHLTSTSQQFHATVTSCYAENPLLLQVALGQGIPLSELVAEPAQDPVPPAGESDTPVEPLPPAADAISIHEHPAVKKADVRLHGLSVEFCDSPLEFFDTFRAARPGSCASASS